MYKLILLFTLICCSLSYSQLSKPEKHKIVYTSNNNFELIVNKEKTFSNNPVILNRGLEVEINSFHGLYLFKHLSVSIGVGLAYHISENIAALPIVGEFRYHLNPQFYEGLFVSLNTGRNLKIGSFKSGSSAKLAIGYLFESNSDFMYTISFFAKSKEYTLDNTTNYNLQTLSIGVSTGIHF